MSIAAEIYALRHPVTNEIRYIGKANDSLKRLASHLRETRRKTPLYSWIESLRKQGLTPNVTVICQSKDWVSDEKRIIAEYRNTHRLLNIADGGDEPKCSIETRAANGKKVAESIHSDPKRKYIWNIKKAMAESLRWAKTNGKTELYNRIIDKLQVAGRRSPQIFGNFLTLKHI